MPKTWTDFSISSILDLEGYKTNNGYLRDEYHHDHRQTTLKEKASSLEDIKNSSSTDECNASSPPRKKKSRTVFTRQQIQHLENAFDRKKYFTNSERQKMATDLMLSETQVKIWLQNRRNKWKKQLLPDTITSTNTLPLSPPISPYLQSPTTNYNKILHNITPSTLLQRNHDFAKPSLLTSPIPHKTSKFSSYDSKHLFFK